MMSADFLANNKTSRILFIDLARTVAILMMLEGHFVDCTLLADREVYVGQPIYDIWLWLRGITAPLFLTVSGMIFTYLLLAHDPASYWKRSRVKKGLKRAWYLLLIGYAIQACVFRIPSYLQGSVGSWVWKFHILQCVAFGLLLLLLLFAFLHRVKPWSTYLICTIGLSLILFTRSAVLQLPENSYIPNTAPEIIQNIIKGPNSQFPIAPWLAFILLGAILGRYIRSTRCLKKAPLFLLLIALVMFTIKYVMKYTDFTSAEMRNVSIWFSARAAQVACILSLLSWIESRGWLKTSNFLKIGQETFAIYILHFIVLYGGVFGISLSYFFAKKLEPWQAALGAIIFTVAHSYFGIWWSKRQKTGTTKTT